MSERLSELWRQYMRRGNFEAAWQISDVASRKRDHFADCSADPESSWRGELLHGKRVLVRCCYGLGDTLMFVRYLPLLRAVARHVTLQAHASVARVLERQHARASGRRHGRANVGVTAFGLRLAMDADSTRLAMVSDHASVTPEPSRRLAAGPW